MGEEKIFFKVEAELAGKRIDKFLSDRHPDFSRRYFQNLIDKRKVKVGGREAVKDYILKAGDEIEVLFEEAESISLEPDSTIKFGIVFDGKDFAVIEKPAGLVVHPSYTHKKGTLVNGLLARWPEIREVGEDSMRPGIVHRLDKETSGLMVVAKSQPMFLWLKKQFQDRKVEKKYIALVYGNISRNEGEITAPIGRLGVKQVAINSSNKGLSGNVNKSRNARTGFKILARYNGFTLVEATPYTGRMHQIRVHFKYLGYPIVGDKKYAGRRISKPTVLQRHFLHSSYLAFNLPNGERMEFKSELPIELMEFLISLEK